MKYVPSELHTEHLMSLATFDSIITSPSLLTFHHLLLPLLNPLRISPRPISTCQLHSLPHLHSKPIYLVVFKGSYSCDGISYLEGGFTLRCLQRLSRPDLATLRWDWFPAGTPAVRPSRSSRTKDSSSQISYAHAG